MKASPKLMPSFKPISNLLFQNLQEKTQASSNTLDYHKSKTCIRKRLKLIIEVKIYEHDSLKIKKCTQISGKGRSIY